MEKLQTLEKTLGMIIEKIDYHIYQGKVLEILKIDKDHP